VETDIESGLRWGELTELRVKDLDFDTQLLTVSRAVVELTPKHHPGGQTLSGQGPPQGQAVMSGAATAAGPRRISRRFAKRFAKLAVWKRPRTTCLPLVKGRPSV
jgi:hypothetical protein